MNLPDSFLQQLRRVYSSIIFIFNISTFFIGIVVLIHGIKGVPYKFLTSDPTAVTHVGPYVGFLSTSGLFFWSATATICFFTALFSKDPALSLIRSFLWASGSLTLLLGFDDAFLFHEKILPSLAGIPETYVLIGYLIVVSLYLTCFYKIILRSEYLLLMIALVFFGISMILDKLIPVPGNPYLFEDGSKFIGIVSWLAYFARVCSHRE